MQRGSTPRTRALRRESLDALPHIDMQRAALVTKAYKLYQGSVSTPELRALCLLHYFENKTLYIGEGELIVGEKGARPQAAPTFPELCCHTVEDLRIMRDRPLIPFDVTDDDIAFQADVIIPYWQKRSLRSHILRAMSPQWTAAYQSGLFTEFMEQRGPGHTVGSEVIYQKGFEEHKADIQKAIEALDFTQDLDAPAKREELFAMAIACDAIMALGRRYRDYALELAGKTADAARRAELETIAANCAVVPAHRPQTFHQALQMYWFVHLAVTSEINPWDAYSPGRLDQHLLPFYKHDTAAGTLDNAGALELLECLFIKFNNQPAPPKVGITLKESGTYTDFANINTGGITPDGQNGVNPVSYLILDCMDELMLTQPSSNVQISTKTPQAFLLKACAISRKGWGQPAFYNTEAIVQELLNAGKALADARRGGTSGCVETGAFGSEAYILTGYFNLPKVLELALFNGYDHVAGLQLGPKTGSADTFSTFDDLFAAFQKQMDYFLALKLSGNHIIESLYARQMPVPLLSVITNDCIVRGKDYNAGGARYNTSYIQGVGIGTITDALAAIRHNVYELGRINTSALCGALLADFEGHELIHHLVKNRSPKYGNDDDGADELMRRIFFAFHDAVTGRPNVRGGSYRINMLPTTCHVYFGQVMLASANGRRAHMPVSEGISPEKGADVNGPTAVIRSAAKMDQLLTGGTLLNQKFAPSLLSGDSGLEHMASLIRAYFSLDGHHIQFNVIDRQTLLNAQLHPGDYRDLIVRVAGYSDHFRNLDKPLQDEIIQRTEQSFAGAR